MEYTRLQNQTGEFIKRKIPIVTPTKSDKILIHKSPSFEYSLSNSLIDPNKSSPPSDFQIKLYERIQTFSRSNDS